MPVDGNPDAIGTAVPDRQLVSGPQGAVMTTDLLESTIVPPGGTVNDVADAFYMDDDATTIDECWGADADFLGAHGNSFVTAIPNTDPAMGAAIPFRSMSVYRFARPGATAPRRRRPPTGPPRSAPRSR